MRGLDAESRKDYGSRYSGRNSEKIEPSCSSLWEVFQAEDVTGRS